MSSREYNLMRRYGITLEQYDSMLTAQDGRCAVCKKHHTEFKINLAVDHDHKTGEVYGLLCTYCNQRFIGRDRDPQKYRNAAEFLDKGTGWFVPEDAPKRTKKRKKRSKKGKK